jgi:hypothetical protein
MYNLGYCFDKGEGVEQNLAKAVEWFTKAAEKGHSSAMSNLGRCFKKGQGVEQNLAKAVEWYTKAAEKGHSTAMNNLGICFHNGVGVEQNSTKAVEWYTKAAEKGDSTAMNYEQPRHLLPEGRGRGAELDHGCRVVRQCRGPWTHKGRGISRARPADDAKQRRVKSPPLSNATGLTAHPNPLLNLTLPI